MNPLGTVSVAALRQYVRAAQARQLPVEDLLQTAGIPPATLDSDDGRIDGTQLQEFLYRLCQHSRDPLLGLKTGDFVQPGSYSVLGYITMSCATLGEAVQRIAPFEKLVGDMGTTTLEDRGERIRLTWHCTYQNPIVRPQLVDNVFASWINYARWLAEPTQASPTAVHLQRPAPSGDSLREYQQRWDCPVFFEAGEDAIEFDKNLLQTPLRQPDPVLRSTLERHAQQQLASLQSASELINQVRNSIYQNLLEGITRQDMVAGNLGMTSRTLQRKLSQEDTSYQQLLDDVRQDMAEDYLSRTTLPIPDIALRLGFSETTSFHRIFKRRVGMTPGEYRQKTAEQKGKD